jgi:hypothetical protein
MESTYHIPHWNLLGGGGGGMREREREREREVGRGFLKATPKATAH